MSSEAEENTEEVSTGTGVPLVASEGRAASSLAERLTVVARDTTNKITFRSWTEGSG